jgi:hypothetical protein
MEMATTPYALIPLHGTLLEYSRIRLLTSEASTSGTVVVILATGTWIYTRAVGTAQRRLGRVAAAVLFLCYTFVSGSKGYVLVLALAGLLLSATVPAIRRNLWKVFAVSSLGILAALVLFQRVAGNLLYAIQETSTAATRGALMLATFEVPLRYPLGSGFGPSDIVLTESLGRALARMSEFLPLNAQTFGELDAFGYSRTGLHPKTAVGEFLLFTGIVGGLLLWQWHRALWRSSSRDTLLRFAYLFIALSLATYLPLLNKYDVWFFFALLERVSGQAGSTVEAPVR